MIIVIRRNIDKVSGFPDIVLGDKYYIYFSSIYIFPEFVLNPLKDMTKVERLNLISRICVLDIHSILQSEDYVFKDRAVVAYLKLNIFLIKSGESGLSRFLCCFFLIKD